MNYPPMPISASSWRDQAPLPHLKKVFLVHGEPAQAQMLAA